MIIEVSFCAIRLKIVEQLAMIPRTFLFLLIPDKRFPFSLGIALGADR